MAKATPRITANRDQGPLLLGDSVPSWGKGKFGLCSEERLSWVSAAEVTSEEIGHRGVVVEFGELLSCEALSRHKALVAVCKTGNEFSVVAGPHLPEPGFAHGRKVVVPLGRFESCISSIRSVLPFQAPLIGVQHLGGGRHLLRFIVGTITTPVLDEVVPVPQLFWSNGVVGLHLCKGFYGIEQEGERWFSWMGGQGKVLVVTKLTRLVKVTLWVEPFVPRPQKINFHGNCYNLFAKTEIAAFHCVIPGHNPLNLSLEGPIDSPRGRGLSDDSRDIGLKLVGGVVTLL